MYKAAPNNPEVQITPKAHVFCTKVQGSLATVHLSRSGSLEPTLRSVLYSFYRLSSYLTCARIEANLTLEFVIIVNPNNGPGSEPWWPNVDYVREISRLNAYSNVRTVGYVHTSYCKRSVQDVHFDIEKYAGWSKDTRYPGLGVSGIFFDETPNVFSKTTEGYLRAVTENAKQTIDVGGDALVSNLYKDSQCQHAEFPFKTIHNPGTSMDQRLFVPGLDVATISEICFAEFKTQEYRDWLATSPLKREETSFMLYAVPDEEVEELIGNLKERAGYLFVTNRKTDAYHAFGDSWKRFIAAMAAA